MTRQIEASEVREGMEVEWTSRGWYHRGVVAAVTRNHPGGVWVLSSDGFEMSVEPDQVFTVLSEPQPEEPTAFGACVEVAGGKYIRADNSDDIPWVSGLSNGYDWCFWDDICRQGTVTVINPDPFANTEPREPRVWDLWADVPEMTPVRVGDSYTLYRKVDGRIERKPWAAWAAWATCAANESDLNQFPPFTEVRDA